MSHSTDEFPPGGATPGEIPLDARRSVPASQLGGPGPDDAMLHRLLQSAVRVPDHGRRVPFRFLRIAGESRAWPATRRAPLVVAVVAVLGPDDAIPESERFSSAACTCFALLQAAQAFGFGAQWLTGWAAYDASILRALGVGGHERIAGFVHIGTPRQAAPERDRPDPRTLLSDWHPPA